MSDPMRNAVDDAFIEDLRGTIAHVVNLQMPVMQKYIKQLVQHEVDVITDSDWFQDQILQAAREALNDD